MLHHSIRAGYPYSNLILELSDFIMQFVTKIRKEVHIRSTFSQCFTWRAKLVIFSYSINRILTHTHIMISICPYIHGHVPFAYPTRYLDILRVLHATCDSQSFVHCTQNGVGLQIWFFLDSIKQFWQKQFYSNLYIPSQNEVTMFDNIFSHFQLWWWIISTQVSMVSAL